MENRFILWILMYLYSHAILYYQSKKYSTILTFKDYIKKSNYEFFIITFFQIFIFVGFEAFLNN